MTTIIAKTFLAAFLILSSALSGAFSAEAHVSVWFSPRGGGLEAVVGEIHKAKKTIRVQAYSFTSPAITQALIDAHHRKVDVQAIFDRGQKNPKYTMSDEVRDAGIPSRWDHAHAIAHNKIIIIDGKKVLTGSYNFTDGAEKRNAENLLLLESSGLAKEYLRNWQKHWEHSKKLQP